MWWFLGVLIFLGYLKGSSSSGLEEITCRGQKKQTLKNLFSFGNKSLIVALAFSLGSFAATSWSFFFAMKKESRDMK
jgi:hypothetical protein